MAGNGERFVAVGWGATTAWARCERFVAVSYEGVTRYSADGDRWEPAYKVPPPIHCTMLPWGNGRLAAAWQGSSPETITALTHAGVGRHQDQHLPALW